MASAEIDHKLLLRRSLLAIDDLKAKLAVFEQAASEPIAVVGAGCRLPGGVETPDAFWELLVHGTDTVTEVPRDRWDVDAYYDPNPDTPGKSYSRWGAFLENVDLFDADFFGISPREAVSLDPQQRLLLEVTWEALENAGIAPARLMGSQTAVYLGITTHDYAARFAESGSFTHVDGYMASGTTHSMAAGRLAYVFGLQGPNAAIDTACSSSIVATHLAVQSLRNREADIALAAGVNLTLTPTGAILTSRARMASPTGRCHTFDASADGYVRGEGCIVLVLKRLSDAQRDGDHVLALIRGSALNQDGRSSGLTAPFGPSQEAVIRTALANARLTPADVSFVEAHGTGTSLGDPIEMKALGESYGRARTIDQPLMVGSVKTNLGHLEGAAGIAGLLKVILSLQHKTIAPHLHFKTPNPLIPWDQYPVTVPTAVKPWTVPDNTPRRAGISSFGFSGTNGHVIVEEAPVTESIQPAVDRPLHVLPLSAQTQDSLTELAARYAAYLGRDDAARLADIVSTAALGRSHFHERVAVVAATHTEAREKLLAVSQGHLGPGIVKGCARGGFTPEVVFMCTGQGAQYPGMTRQLYDTQPTFKRILDQCAEVLDRELEQPLLSVLFPEDSTSTHLHETAYTQPALFAVEYALAQLWRSWGIEPSLVLGHSVGEYVAACLAGVFSLDDALRLIAARGRLMGRLPRNGAMAAIFAEESRVSAAIQHLHDRVSIAGVNGPTNIVISGETTAIDSILEQLSREGVEFQRLTVSHAFHSPLMDGILDEFEAIAATVTFSVPTIGLISNVTGAMAGDEITTPSYWRRHLRDAVRFADSIATAGREGYHIFLEIGPSPTLIGMARRCLAGDDLVWLPSLRKGVDDWSSMLETLGTLYVRGCKVDWSGFERDYISGRQRVVLPTYPFKRQRYWLTFDAKQDVSQDVSHRPHLTALRSSHPLVDGKLATASDIFETQVSLAVFPYLEDHRIAGLVLFPTTAYIELALATARETLGTSSVSVADFTIREALVVPDNDTVTVQIVFSAARDGSAGFQVFSAPSVDEANAPLSWTLHATGRVATADGRGPVEGTLSLESMRAQCPHAFDVAGYYHKLESIGAEYGPTFQGVREIRLGTHQVLGHIQLPDRIGSDVADYIVHPALLDACLQLPGAGLPNVKNISGDDDLYALIGIDTVHLVAPAGNDVWCHVTLPETVDQSDTTTADLTLITPTGQIVALIRGLTLKRMTATALRRLLRNRSRTDWIYEITWRAVTTRVQKSITNPNHWILIADELGLTASLADHLRAQGHTVDVIASSPGSNRTAHSSLADLSDMKRLRVLMANVMGTNTLPLAGVVYLAAIDSPNPLSLAIIQAAEQRILTGAFAVAQACAESGTRLWLVTRGSQPVAGSTPDIVQGPLWGMGGVAASEYPAIACTRIDLDPTVAATSLEQVEQLTDLLLAASDEEQIALRAGTRYVARLTQGRLTPPSDIPMPRPLITDSGTYLITGGLGGLGLTIARWMADEGARHLVLMGRNAPSASATSLLAELAERGVQVAVARGDVSTPDDVARVVRDINESPFPLRGIMHVAGIVDDAMIPEQDWPRIERVLAPKVWGAWNLHTATLALPLDFFVMFSAGAAILGSPGQSNYAAANLFLDMLAHARRAQGLPALSIDWGSWSEVGMAANVSEQHRRRWAALGLGMIAPDEGMRMMHDLMLDGRAPQAAVLPLTVSKLQTTSPFYRELVRSAGISKTAVPSSATTGTPHEDVHKHVSEAQTAERAPLVVTFLREQLVRILALDPSYHIDPHRSIMEMGLDSLMAMELRNRIDTNLRVRISVADLLVGPSVHQLADAILSKFVVAGEMSSDVTEPMDDAELLATLETMSEENLDAQLERLLAEAERDMTNNG